MHLEIYGKLRNCEIVIDIDMLDKVDKFLVSKIRSQLFIVPYLLVMGARYLVFNWRLMIPLNNNRPLLLQRGYDYTMYICMGNHWVCMVN